MRTTTYADYLGALVNDDLDDGPGLLVVEGGAAIPPPAAAVERFSTVPFVVVTTSADAGEVADVVVEPGGAAFADLDATVAANPIAASALCLLLRGAERRGVGDGLVAESSTYSTLQAGPEFARWLRTARRRHAAADHGRPVRSERLGQRLLVTLSRPHVRNALDRRMRDELTAALAVGLHDPSIVEIVLAGEGPAFCAGGDLDEFGTFEDPAGAHLVRLTRSPARLLAALADRVTARLHGTCYGSGIELPAFAGRVVADPGTTFALPEVRLGLVPGAGGTVSLPKRIGRHRTAMLALTAAPIVAATALSWGLIDAIEPVEH